MYNVYVYIYMYMYIYIIYYTCAIYPRAHTRHTSHVTCHTCMYDTSFISDQEPARREECPVCQAESGVLSPTVPRVDATEMMETG